MYRFVVILLVAASPAPAVTFVTPIPSPVLAAADPLGQGCIDGGGYDDPFPGAKGVRPPAFCLPQPCEASLTRAQLGRDVLGREATDTEWDAYYSRYAEYCRAEAIVVPTPGETRVASRDDFWAPLIPVPAVLGFSTGSRGSVMTPRRPRPPGSGGEPPLVFAGGPTAGPPPEEGPRVKPKTKTGPEPKPAPEDEGERKVKPQPGTPVDLAVVPVPLALWLLATAIATLGALRLRRRSG